MLLPTQYPLNYPSPKKLEVFKEQAHALGKADRFYRVHQTTFFHNGPNNTGVEMYASTGSGQDCTGVNDGSKNSVLMNYIPDAYVDPRHDDLVLIEAFPKGSIGLGYPLPPPQTAHHFVSEGVWDMTQSIQALRKNSDSRRRADFAPS